MRVLVIGASSGIGKALAVRHASRHDEVILVARSEGELGKARTLCQSKGASTAKAFTADVTKLADCHNLLKAVGGADTHIDMCYFAVGRGAHQVHGTAWHADDATTDVYKSMLDVNFFGPLNVLRVFLPALSKSRAHLVFLNSASGIVGLPGRAAYCASKAALMSMCETLVADAEHPVTLTEIFVVSVSGTNLRKSGIVSGMDGPAVHQNAGQGTSSSELPLEQAVEEIFSQALKKTRRVYLPSKLRLAPIVKHLPLVPSDALLERLVWKKARL